MCAFIYIYIYVCAGAVLCFGGRSYMRLETLWYHIRYCLAFSTTMAPPLGGGLYEMVHDLSVL